MHSPYGEWQKTCTTSSRWYGFEAAGHVETASTLLRNGAQVGEAERGLMITGMTAGPSFD